jgi:hypothetical protein
VQRCGEGSGDNLYRRKESRSPSAHLEPVPCFSCIGKRFASRGHSHFVFPAVDARRRKVHKLPRLEGVAVDSALFDELLALQPTKCAERS